MENETIKLLHTALTALNQLNMGEVADQIEGIDETCDSIYSLLDPDETGELLQPTE